MKDNGEAIRGYKLASLRGLLDDSGIIEEIEFGPINIHDLELSKDLLLNSKVLKEGDILINDRGFISREVINTLKTDKKVDTYVPARKNMSIYKEAVKIAKAEGNWRKYPNKKRTTQEIQFVKDLGVFWESKDPTKDVPLNACVVHDKKINNYFVFLSTETNCSARQIVNTYELRPEIEEDFRQIKDFWKLEDFKSTKYDFITFHIVTLLIGYMYFQLFKNTEKGSKYSKKSLPVVLKNYTEKKKSKSVVIYSGQYFGIFTFLEFMKLYANCSEEVKGLLEPTLALV
ncbi:MAG: transposase [Firmicutes bacterium]|nr:transposase [Bacillota bacterium]